MAPSRTKTVKNKHSGSKSSAGKHASKKSGPAPPPDGIVRSATKPTKKGTAPARNSLKTKVQQLMDKRKKNKNKKYTDEELGVPKLNMITPVGVEKPRGKKKGKVFVDDRVCRLEHNLWISAHYEWNTDFAPQESMNTILAMVQAEKEGQIESKMMKARQLEEIREARKVEAEKKEEEKKSKLEDVKEGLRKKRKRNTRPADDEDNVNALAVTGTKATKSKKKVAFA